MNAYRIAKLIEERNHYKRLHRADVVFWALLLASCLIIVVCSRIKPTSTPSPNALSGPSASTADGLERASFTNQ